ncbi:hypothetical protein F1602_09830 [Pseudomonas putida]|nr:hypothetical protein F1602_09830 [Pseudomonas putida]
MLLGCVHVCSWLKAAPEEKRSAFYGVKADCGRAKHDADMIGDPTPNYLTFQSKTARRECALLRRLTYAKGEHRHAFPTPTKKPAEAGFLTTYNNQSSRPMMPNSWSRLTNRL